nr:MAG TPA: hypothetical protein [Caudoviricetes sp.]
MCEKKITITIFHSYLSKVNIYYVMCWVTTYTKIRLGAGSWYV